jgi:hypothetical protein
MKQKNYTVYLALILLIFLIFVFPINEGFDGHGWLDYSSWFTTTPRLEKDIYNSNEGRGNSGKKYVKTEDENNELTSFEKTYARSALNKISAMHDNNDLLKSCINKVKVYL